MTDVTSTTSGKGYLRRPVGSVLAIFTLVTGLNSHRAAAIEYTWPVITGVEVTLINANSANYKLTWTVVTVKDDTIAPKTRAVDVYAMKKGIVIPNLFSAVRHRHNRVGNSPSGGTVTGSTTADSMTLEEYSSQVSSYFPRSVTMVSHGNGPNGNECVGLITSGTANVASATWEGLLSRNWDGGIGSMGECLGTPPANEWCALVSPAVEINYGTMSVAEAVGANKSSAVAVSCTTGMKYTLRLRGENNISLSNGMHAELKADGLPLNSTLDGVAGMNNVILSSTLNGEPLRTGEFKGEGVLFVSYP